MGRSLRYLVLTACGLASAACAPNSPPRMDAIIPQTFFVGRKQSMQLRAFDADGDNLTFSFSVDGLTGIHQRARIDPAPTFHEARFVWEPLFRDAGQHSFDFEVSDGPEKDIETVILTVKESTESGNAPEFVRPNPVTAGMVVRLDQSSAGVQFDVEVRDADSTDVDIQLNQTIPGASVGKLDRYRARFRWCPTSEQLLQSRQWLVLFVASDGENPPVEQEYTLQLEGNPICQGGGPPPGTGSLTVPFYLDLETSDGSLSGDKDWQWGPPSASLSGNDCDPGASPPPRANSGNNVWGTRLDDCYSPLQNNAGHDSCRNGDPLDDSVLRLKFHVPNQAGARVWLRYAEWADFSAPLDWAEVRLNGQTVLDQYCASAQPQAGWNQKALELPGVAGQTVEVSWHFMASSANQRAGWYIDDISVDFGNGGG